MFKISDFFLLSAVAISFIVSGMSYFGGYEIQGLFTAIWVPSILAFGIYFKLSVLIARGDNNGSR